MEAISLDSSDQPAAKSLENDDALPEIKLAFEESVQQAAVTDSSAQVDRSKFIGQVNLPEGE